MTPPPLRQARPALIIAMAVTISLYFLWGMAHNLNDILVAQFKKAFELSNFQAGLVQSAFYCAYLVMPLPVSVLMHRLGYRRAVMTGLGLYGLGALLFWPAAEVLRYEFFLFALFVIASGIVFLETSGLAIMSVLGPQDRLERRINFASAFNPVGSITGIVIGQQFIFSSADPSPAAQAQAVQMPYLIIGCVVLCVALVVRLTPYPKAVDETQPDFRLFSGLRALTASPRFSLGVVTQFLSVGSQIGAWSYLILYARAAVPGLDDADAATYLILSLLAFMVGRFITTALLHWFSNAHLCAVAGAANVVLCLIAVTVGGQTGLWALVGVGFFMSVMFPAIYTMGLHGHAERARLGSALMIMSIIGGAVITALMGAVADDHSIALAYGVPMICFLVVSLYSLWALRDLNKLKG